MDPSNASKKPGNEACEFFQQKNIGIIVEFFDELGAEEVHVKKRKDELSDILTDFINLSIKYKFQDFANKVPPSPEEYQNEAVLFMEKLDRTYPFYKVNNKHPACHCRPCPIMASRSSFDVS